ncbi:MAG TPA: pyruvate kinase [Patescibacteria group bacterium]
MHKQTKVVATIGPATETEEMLEQLILAGMNVARFNTKHSEPAWHNERIKRVKKVAKKLNTYVGVLLDLQGPEIRINLPDEKPFDVKAGDSVIFTSDKEKQGKNIVWVPQDVVDSLSTENLVLLDDGAAEFIIVDKDAKSLVAKTITDCTIKHRKTMNTPGVVLDMPSLTERDYAYLDQVKPELVDFVGLSFVRTDNDVEILRAELEKRKIKAQVVAKIENEAALEHLDELIAASDVVMVARGDLGVEVPYEELIHWQRVIIDKCRLAGKPVITATQMLKSMMVNPRPTRSEVSDVAHAIYDGTDAVMLSDETTIGKYPVKAVQVQSKIAEYNDPKASTQFVDLEQMITTVTGAITHAAYQLSQNSTIKATKIVCLTESGSTVRLLARFRPTLPIVAIASSTEIAQKLSVVYGTTASVTDIPKDTLLDTPKLTEKLKSMKVVETGETIILVHGSLWKQPGLTNTMAVLDIK